MEIVNFVPLSASLSEVYRMIPREQVNINDMMEWAADGYLSMEIKQLYEERIKVIPVQNYKAPLPADLKFLDQTFYKETLNEVDDTTVTLYTSEDGETITTKLLSFAFYAENADWKPLILSTSIFAKTIACQNVPRIGGSYDNYYSIDKTRCMTVSFETGYVAVAYYSLPRTADGEMLIPDDRDVKKALESYVLSQVFMQRYILGLDGAENRYKDFLAKWEIFRGKCVGKIMLQGINELENMRRQWDRIGMHGENYTNAFSTLNHPEYIKLNKPFQ